MWLFAIMSQLASCPCYRIGHHQTGDVAGAGVLVAGVLGAAVVGTAQTASGRRYLLCTWVSCKGESGEMKLSCG